MTRIAINTALGTLSLLLQAGLVGLLFRRGLARRIPTFTVLLSFYLLRLLMLFLFSHQLSPSVYNATYNIFGVVDLLLQLALAIELELRLFPIPGAAPPSVTLRRLGFLLLLPTLAFAGALLLSASLPAKAAVPTDRLQLFDSLFFLLLGVLAIARTSSIYLLRVIAGLAIYAVICIASIIGRTFATFHRDLQAYVGWSYAASIVWLLIVFVWLFALQPNQERPTD